MYVKLINNELKIAPINKGNIINYNLDTELLIQDGYKEFIEIPKPETIRLYHIEYIENETTIAENIVYDETQEEAEQRIAQKEAERIGNLTMTALDFITFLRQCGLTLEQIRAYLDANIELDTQLKYCQNVYCRVARSVMPITVGNITITADMVENAFKVKNGEV